MDLLTRRREIIMNQEDYIVFADPIVEQICANTWGDGVGLKPSKAKQITSLGTVFRENTSITQFDELQYFTSLTTITAGSSTSVLGAFGGCTNLKSIVIPSRVTTIGAYAFYGCEGLLDVTLSSTVTTLGTYSFAGCTKLKLTVNGDVTINNYAFTNDGTQELIFTNKSNITAGYPITGGNSTTNSIFRTNGNLSKASNNSLPIGLWSKYYIGGDLIQPNNNYIINNARNREFHISGDIRFTNASGGTLAYINNTRLAFVEVGGIIINTKSCHGGNGSRYQANNFIWHFAKTDGIACSATVAGVSNSRVAKVYVGDGSSQANDQAVLNMYLADTDWAQYASKLDLWYNYTGEFKTT